MTNIPEEPLSAEEMGFPFGMLDRGLCSMDNTLYGRRAKNEMKADVQEHETGYTIDIDLPGFKRDQISLDLENGFLTVTAEKHLDREEKDSACRIIHQERFTSELRRSFYVGDTLTEDDVKARYADGVLRLALAKQQEKQPDEPKRIRIEG